MEKVTSKQRGEGGSPICSKNSQTEEPARAKAWGELLQVGGCDRGRVKVEVRDRSEGRATGFSGHCEDFGFTWSEMGIQGRNFKQRSDTI